MVFEIKLRQSLPKAYLSETFKRVLVCVLLSFPSFFSRTGQVPVYCLLGQGLCALQIRVHTLSLIAENGPAKVNVPLAFHNLIVREQEYMILPKTKPCIKVKCVNSQCNCVGQERIRLDKKLLRLQIQMSVREQQGEQMISPACLSQVYTCQKDSTALRIC